METFKSIGIFCLGASGYGVLETTFRGFTHWTMVLTGGAVFLALYELNRQFSHASFYKKCIAGGLIITCFEFFVGCIVNLWLGWGVWNYKNYNNNILGQVCPFYTLHWFALTAVLLFFAELPQQIRLRMGK